MNTDTRPNHFKDSLLAAIVDEFDTLTATPTTAANSSRHTRDRRDLRWLPARRTVVTLAAGTAAATLAITGAVALSAHSPNGANRVANPGPHLSVRTVAYVVDHLQAAIDTNAGWVLKTFEHAPDSQTGQPTYTENWASNMGDTTRSDTLDPQGNPTLGYVVTTTAHQTTTIAINYQDRTWSTTTYQFGPSTFGPEPAPQTPAQGAAQLQADVTAGTVSETGPATIDGQDAIGLQEGTPQTGMQYIWVNPTTYLPIREIDTAPGVSPASDQAIRTGYEWLPATAANLQLLTASAAIPAGFTQVP